MTYASLVYFDEREPDLRGLNCTSISAEKDPCYSWTMEESFWRGLMTLTTVCYDLYPKTMWGKMIGGFCALSGIFILTLPIPIVVNSFVVFYKNRLWRTEVNALKRERIRKNAREKKEMEKMTLLKVNCLHYLIYNLFLILFRPWPVLGWQWWRGMGESKRVTK